jgi:signal transduction histidine kinase/streptogramin lyase
MRTALLSERTKLLLCVLAAFAGSLTVRGQRYPFYNLSVENGLIQSQAWDITQDKTGHLWVGTMGGLSRFDGRGFTNYSLRDGMLSNIVYTVTTDKQGTLWVGGDKGISRYDGKGFRHFIFDSPENPSGNAVNQIEVSEDGKIWCLSGKKIYSIDKEKKEELKMPAGDADVTAIYPERGTIWMARQGGTIYRYANKKWDSLAFPKSDQGFKLQVTKIFRDHRKRIWLTTNTGVFQLDNGHIAPAKAGNMEMDKLPPVLCIAEDKHGAIWMGLTSGVLRMTDTTLYYFNKKNGLSDNKFESILTDAEGNVWMASDGQGIFRFSGAQFTVLDESTGLPSEQVMSIESDRYGRLYLGTYDAGLYVYENGKVSTLSLPLKSRPAIMAMRHKGGDLWLGTSGAGLWKYNGSVFYSFNTSNSALPSNTITSLYVDPMDRLWIGTINGAAYRERDSFHKLQLKNTAVQDFIQIGYDSILLATSNGIKLYHADNIYSFTTGKAPDSSSPHCFALKGRELWIGTSDNGLLYYNLDSKKSMVFNKSNGMQSDFIYNVTTDDDGNVWAGTGFGLHKVRLKENGQPSISFYGKGQGILGMESNHNAVYKMADGSIWFGTTNGAIHYRPQSKIVTPSPISIALQSVKVFGESITDSSYFDSTDIWYKVPYGLHLPPRKNNITFTFQAISLSSSEQIKYRYRIEGLDAPWSDWSNINTVTYSALPPGKYTLMVESSTGDGEERIKQLLYPFEIITPFHKTTWFRFVILAGCILLGVSIQYIVNKRKQNRLILVETLRREEQAKVRQRTAEDFHDEVGNKLTRINVLTNVLKNKIGTLTPDTKRILDQIQDNTGQLYSGTRDILWSLKPSNDSLYEILHRIRDFGGELFQDTEIDFIFTGTDEKWKDYKMPLDVSRNLIMIFKEALNNALKYAQATEVRIDARLRPDDALQLVLSDNGGGFDPQYVKKGHGIDNMNVRAARIQGRLYIDSRKDKGTIINLTFKLPSNRG